MATQRDIYISTNDGLYRGKVNGGIMDVDVIGLVGMGTLRAPVIVDVKNPNTLYVGTRRAGMLRSDDAGKTWRETNNGLIYKEVWSLAQHPTTGELYAGTGPAAVFRSNDGGENWSFSEQLHSLPETIEWTFPNPPHIAHIKGFGLSKNDPNMVYAAIEEGYLIRSKDGGTTWQTLHTGTTIDSHTVSVMPDNPNVLVSASGNGIFRSEDAGDHFVLSSDGLTREYVSQIVFHENEPNLMFTAAAAVPPRDWRRPEGADTGFFRSEDQGRSWKQLAGNGLPDHMVAAPRGTAGFPDRAGTFLAAMNDGSVWMTDDYGEHFKQAVKGLPPVYGITISAN
jgi:photosystem II stability/assembly factor-like uncharacterized protein